MIKQQDTNFETVFSGQHLIGKFCVNCEKWKTKHISRIKFGIKHLVNYNNLIVTLKNLRYFYKTGKLLKM